MVSTTKGCIIEVATIVYHRKNDLLEWSVQQTGYKVQRVRGVKVLRNFKAGKGHKM